MIKPVSKMILAFGVCVSAMMLSANVQAQVKPILKKGTHELTLQGFADFEASDDYYYFLEVGYGKFRTDALELGLDVGVTSTDVETRFSLGPFIEYNFVGESQVVPYLGFGAQWVNADLDIGRGGDLVNTSSDALLLDAELGAKYFLAENIAISTSVAYEWATDKIFHADDSAKDGNALLKLGMRFFF